MQSDPVYPILHEKHLQALDRRLRIVLQAIRDCIQSRPDKSVIFFDDEFQQSRGDVEDQNLKSLVQMATSLGFSSSSTQPTGDNQPPAIAQPSAQPSTDDQQKANKKAS